MIEKEYVFIATFKLKYLIASHAICHANRIIRCECLCYGIVDDSFFFSSMKKYETAASACDEAPRWSWSHLQRQTIWAGSHRQLGKDDWWETGVYLSIPLSVCFFLSNKWFQMQMIHGQIFLDVGKFEQQRIRRRSAHHREWSRGAQYFPQWSGGIGSVYHCRPGTFFLTNGFKMKCNTRRIFDCYEQSCEWHLWLICLLA